MSRRARSRARVARAKGMLLREEGVELQNKDEAIDKEE